MKHGFILHHRSFTFCSKGRKVRGKQNKKYYGRNRHTQSHEQTESKGKTIFTTLVPSGSP